MDQFWQWPEPMEPGMDNETTDATETTDTAGTDGLNAEQREATHPLPGHLDAEQKRELRHLAGVGLQEPYGADAAAVDPLGSWTGVPADPAETPTQDADDL